MFINLNIVHIIFQYKIKIFEFNINQNKLKNIERITSQSINFHCILIFEFHKIFSKFLLVFLMINETASTIFENSLTPDNNLNSFAPLSYLYQFYTCSANNYIGDPYIP